MNIPRLRAKTLLTYDVLMGRAEPLCEQAVLPSWPCMRGRGHQGSHVNLTPTMTVLWSKRGAERRPS